MLTELLTLFLFGGWTLGCVFAGVCIESRYRASVWVRAQRSPLLPSSSAEGAEPEGSEDTPGKPKPPHTDGVNFTL